jgi:hypothetical protein
MKEGNPMSRICQKKESRGSQHWLQELINRNPGLLAETLRPRLGLSGDDTIAWLSPREDDGYAEYQDEVFLSKLSIHLEKCPIHTFWPSRGPVWDALGKTSRGDILLVEAKAHIPELASPPCGACPSSLALIRKSLAKAAEFYGAAPNVDWSRLYYQYANRLAHLYLLRELNEIQAWLVFLYFVNASEMDGPRSVEEWRPAIDAAHTHLGVTRERLQPYVVDIFFDVTTLRP